MNATANQKFYDALTADQAIMIGNSLFTAEKVILLSLGHEIKDKAILEIGVGSGRVTSHLRSLTPHYTGIDRSPTMVNIARESYPDGRFYLCDAANMSLFHSGAFDAIFFFWNGIDETPYSARRTILAEIERLLRPHGIFVFSAHNLAWNRIPSYAWPGLSRSSDPFVWIWDNVLRLSSYIAILFSFIFATITARGHASLSEYENMPPPMLVPRVYIKPESQMMQLRLAGFQQVEALASDGAALTNHNRDKDYFIYYLARK